MRGLNSVKNETCVTDHELRRSCDEQSRTARAKQSHPSDVRQSAAQIVDVQIGDDVPALFGVGCGEIPLEVLEICVAEQYEAFRGGNTVPLAAHQSAQILGTGTNTTVQWPRSGREP